MQNLRGFCLISAGGFNLSHLSCASSIPTTNVACHMCSDEQHFDYTWDYIHSHWVANLRSLAMSLTLIAIFLLLRQHQSMSMKVNQTQWLWMHDCSWDTFGRFNPHWAYTGLSVEMNLSQMNVLPFGEFVTTALEHNPQGVRAVSLSPFTCCLETQRLRQHKCLPSQGLQVAV